MSVCVRERERERGREGERDREAVFGIQPSEEEREKLDADRFLIDG